MYAVFLVNINLFSFGDTANLFCVKKLNLSNIAILMRKGYDFLITAVAVNRQNRRRENIIRNLLVRREQKIATNFSLILMY